MKKRSIGKSSGFTLIEILVVIVIISILTGLTVVGVTGAMRSARKNSSEALIQALNGALSNYQMRYGDYPPSSLEAFKVQMPNDLNNGVEAMVACLSSTLKGGKVWEAPSEELYSNTDGDRASRNVTSWFFGDLALHEVTDYFQNVLTYMHHRDYVKPGSRMVKYLLREKEKPQTLVPVRSSKTKTYARPDTFQITSAGIDGNLGTSDDLFSW